MSSPEGLTVLPGAEAMSLKGNEVGFLFIHGFTGTPFEGHELASHLHTKLGVTVSVPLLPGHGTAPEELIGLQWEDWYRAVRSEYLRLNSNCSKIVVCGQSMGGTLALHLASHHPVDGLITLAGAAYLKDWRLALLPLAKHLVPYQHKSKGPDVRDKAAKAKIPSYPKYPVKSVVELLEMMRHTREDLFEITAPALLFHSRNDRTVHFSNLDYIYDNISSRAKEKIVLDNSYHIISLDFDKQQIYEKIESFIGKLLEK